MKTLEDLKKMKESAMRKIDTRLIKDGYRVSVGMATCGIAAGARPILNAFLEEIGRLELSNVLVTQVGCIGECVLEPVVEVMDPQGQKTTYCKVTVPMVDQIVKKHIIGGKIIDEYTIKTIKG